MNRAKQKAHIQGSAIQKKTGVKEFRVSVAQILGAKEGVSDAPWSKVNKSKLPRSAFLYAPTDKKSTWKLPYKDSKGNVNMGAIRAIMSALAGGRTGKPMNVPSSVKRKAKNLAKKYGIGKWAKKKKQETVAHADLRRAVALRIVGNANLKTKRGKK